MPSEEANLKQKRNSQAPVIGKPIYDDQKGAPEVEVLESKPSELL